MSALPAASDPEPAPPARVPVQQLVDLSRIGRDGRAPTPSEIRAALPRGWVLEPDGQTARRDLRLFFREGWILLVGLIVFGSAALALFWWSFPRGAAGLLRFAIIVGVVIVAGGLVAPWITRTLNRRT